VRALELVSQSTSVEYVLGLPAQILIRHDVGQGFTGDTFCLDDMLVHAELRPRDEAETDPSWKHFATYAVVCTDRHVLSYLRTKAGGESRLHGLRSIGIGGHVNPGDGAGGARRWSAVALDRAALRELDEEIALPAERRLDFIGFINDDSNPVGRVHIGLVYRCALTSGRLATAQEAAITDCKMLAGPELVAGRDRYETWSQILIDQALDRILFQPS